MEMEMGAKLLQIKDELAGRISIFFAYPTPFSNLLVTSAEAYLNENDGIPRENLCSLLAAIATHAYAHIQSGRCLHAYTEPETQLNEPTHAGSHTHKHTHPHAPEHRSIFCLRSMVGSIVLYDHISPWGAFTKNGPIPLKG